MIMDPRFIIYFVFICLKNFELSWVVSRMNKSVKINFAALGAITTISEAAGFCLIVSQSHTGSYHSWWEDNVLFDNMFVRVGGFLLSVVLCGILLFSIMLFTKQPNSNFIKTAACILVLCSPYLFFLSESQTIISIVVPCLILLLVPIFVASVLTNLVYLVDMRMHKTQDNAIDFRLGEIIWALIARTIGLAAAILVLLLTPLKLERLLYVNTLESILVPITALTVSVIINFVYLSAGVFKVNLPGNRRYIWHSVILSLLNAPYFFLYPIINNVLVNSGMIRGMFAPM